jgi:hypothetical protein
VSQLPLPSSTGNLVNTLTIWKSTIDPVIATQLITGNLISNVSLATGSNNINHLLGRIQVGWMIVDQQAAASIYRSKPFNKSTLTLTASAPATVSLWVF